MLIGLYKPPAIPLRVFAVEHFARHTIQGRQHCQNYAPKSRFEYIINILLCLLNKTLFQKNTVKTAPSFSDSTVAPEMSDNNVRMLAEAYGFQISNDQIAMMRVPNGTKSLMAYTWMETTFALIGDVQPNSDEIHLESMSTILNISQFFCLTNSAQLKWSYSRSMKVNAPFMNMMQSMNQALSNYGRIAFQKS